MAFKISTFFLLAVLFISCDENLVYEEHIDPSGNLEWNRNELVEFNVPIQDTALLYNVTAALRYGQGFMYTSMPVVITKTAPDGNVETIEHQFSVRNEDGSRNGEPALDIWDLEEPLFQNYKFGQKGNYKFTFEHKHQADKVHFVMEVGLIIDKVPPAK